ncbi:MAG: ECF transporter S component [Clostridia bacterium]|nr:ECF transporter S component [Clostridia bacterium]
MNRIAKRHEQTRNMVLVAILAALVVVFQVVSTFIKIGPVSITLTLIPVVLGGCLLGKKWGAILGFLFGVVVTVFVLNGTDVGGYMLFQANPALTVLLCLGKGTVAGFVASLVYKLLEKVNRTAAVTVAAMSAPVVNTGIFVVAMLLFYRDTLTSWAGGADVATYILTGLAGINFLVEFAVSAILSPTVVAVLRATGKKQKNK